MPHSVTDCTTDFDSVSSGSIPDVAATLDDLLTDLATRGWLLNNCYQHDDTTWRVNLRRPDNTGDWFTNWATGPTFLSALEACILSLNDVEFVETQTTTGVVDKSPPFSLAALGLAKQMPKIERRF